MHFVIHDWDTKFPAACDTVFAAEGVVLIRTPYQAPTANAFAECWIRCVREECLDHLLIINERHLEQVLSEYVAYYNHARPGHPRGEGIKQQCPVVQEIGSQHGPVRRREVLGGIIHDYYRRAA